MTKWLCDSCDGNMGTYIPRYTDSGGCERRIMIEYVHCRFSMTRPKIEKGGYCPMHPKEGRW